MFKISAVKILHYDRLNKQHLSAKCLVVGSKKLIVSEVSANFWWQNHHNNWFHNHTYRHNVSCIMFIRHHMHNGRD